MNEAKATPITATGTDIYLLFDTLNQDLQGLHRANSLPKLLDSFLNLLERRHPVCQGALFSCAGQPDSTILTDAKLVPFGEKELTDDQRLAVKQALTTAILSDAEFRRGMHQVCVDGVTFYFCFLGETKSERHLMAWCCTAGEILDRGELALLEVCVGQLQSATRWLTRLDRTHTLIYQDDLTGLFNSRFLDDLLDKEIRRSDRFQNIFSLLFIDLDNFKSINDQFGHLVGSDILRQFGEILRAMLRDIDSIVRYGGDEFVVLLLETSSAAAALAGERIRERVANHKFLNLNDEQEIQLTCSIGIATFPDHAQSKQDLMRLADECMYKSKRSGKNKVHIFRREDHAESVHEEEGTK